MGGHFDDGGRTALQIATPAEGHDSGCEALAPEAGAWLEITYGDADERPANPGEGGPARRGRLVVGDQHGAAVESPDSSGPVVVDTVTDPTDLSSLGTAIGRYVRRWEDDDLAVCFDSVTTLLDHVAEQSAFRFLHLLVERLEKAGAVAHFHLDPTAHDDATITTFTELVDTVERPAPARHGGGQRPVREAPTPAEEHERTEHVADGGVTADDPAQAADRSNPDDVDEATDQEVADAYADL